MCSSSSFVHSPKQKPASQPARRGSGSPAGRPGPPGRRLTSCCSPSPRLKTWLASSEFRPAFREVVAVIGARRNVEAFITCSWAHDHLPSTSIRRHARPQATGGLAAAAGPAPGREEWRTHATRRERRIPCRALLRSARPWAVAGCGGRRVGGLTAPTLRPPLPPRRTGTCKCNVHAAPPAGRGLPS